jgi:hypothetical protein
MSDAATEGELETQMILYQAKMQAMALQQQGALDLTSGVNTGAGLDTAASGTLLTGLTRTAIGAANLPYFKSTTSQTNSGGTSGTGPGLGYTY